MLQHDSHVARDLLQAGPYRSILVTLATLHAQPRMRPEDPRFTQSLLAVSCEVGPPFVTYFMTLEEHNWYPGFIHGDSRMALNVFDQLSGSLRGTPLASPIFAISRRDPSRITGPPVSSLLRPGGSWRDGAKRR